MEEISNARKAIEVFDKLNFVLCSEPVVAFPRLNRTFSLVIGAVMGSGEKKGDLGAHICQTQEIEEPRVIISESRGLSISEKHYTPFLLVMKDA
jgi:hypothetical protein